MAKKRALLIFPKMYSMVNAFEEGFRENGWSVTNHNNITHIKKTQRRIYSNLSKLPSSLREKWQRKFLGQINSKLITEFHKIQPDIVLAYNSGLLLPDTMREMQKNAKVCIYMGDSPFYPNRTDTYLSCLMRADLILCPDSYWAEQLNGMGIKTVLPFLIGCSGETNFVMEPTEEEREKWSSDLVFVGIMLSGSRGQKRAMLLNEFTDHDIKIYADNGIKRWYGAYPRLQSKAVHPDRRLSNKDLNTLLNCCKLYPVDANPGLIHGVHWRIFECIGSGILPLVEYRKDVKEIFGGKGLPIITNYKKASDLGSYYLRNESERKDILTELQSFVEENYSPSQSVGKFVDDLRL